ncbi:hypothetical protein LTR10_019857 [Elasticomyces elasticus]|uniref:Fe2OG dioxygenase domain-containing protein n=1 Tax=Exophiala sideris TaxID=1016849 RepID=A0ABR0IY03_9EURO|nr:hypothetical protein LTR10_019857 [Elasticomyces elasticus]KAK5022419.1 hypothetical protein LTS07_010079 [Exophiala sideris]KAK5027223.1 hypothetical protein LTR13_009618 [Exophiala sideris]KAK5051273.1 hypothetical protein LTR69_010299 [Exophiala sideris]KAK5177763.1 hypothetical protein LTR44_009738 [Eurotiomycetes sp. CCFEE 6388]
MSFPIIDISGIDDPAHQVSIANEVTEACKKWGFLLLRGHPIPTGEIDTMFDLGKSFFHLPESEKAPYPITSSSIGYVGSFQDRGKDDKMSMWFGGVPGTLEAEKPTLPPFWRERTQQVENFKHKCHDLVVKLLECFALSLNLPDRKFFSSAHREDAGNGNALRMLMYPGRTTPEDMSGRGSRMAPHTDSGSVTLLFQRAAGLEVMSPAGQWDCILVNLGDALSFWSGGLLKATLHRVTFDGVPFDHERQTMAYFGAASPETVLQPIVGGTVEEYVSNGLVLTPGVTVGELSKMIMRDIYGAAFQEKDTKPQTAAPTATAAVM